jgi:hypothetical protein
VTPKGDDLTSAGPEQPYESPLLISLGAVHDLTQQDKKYGASDGMTFMGVSITNNS